MGMVDYNRQATKARLLRGERVHWVENSPRRDYIRRVVLSCPPWVSNFDLQMLKMWAKCRTTMTGELHVLDHITPLSHPRVCGLTVPWNLRVVHWKPNLSKGNYWCPEQLELFDLDSFDKPA